MEQLHKRFTGEQEGTKYKTKIRVPQIICGDLLVWSIAGSMTGDTMKND